MKYCLILLLFFFHLGGYAETSQDEIPYLFIPPVTTPKSFTEIENQQIDKIVMKGSAKQTTYQIMIGVPNPNETKKFKWGLNKIEVIISNGPDGYQVLAILKDTRKDKIINSIKEDGIPSIALHRRLEEIINRLFLPQEKPLEDKVDPKPPKSKSEILSKVVPEAEKANINFRDRIMDLKTDINLAVTKINANKAEKKAIEQAKSDEANKKKAENKTQTNSESGLQVANSEPVPIVKPKTQPPLDMGHSLRLGYYNVVTNSLDNKLSTDSNPKYLLFDYEYAMPWPQTSKFYTHANVRYGKAINKEEKEFAPYIGASLLEGYFLDKYGWMPKVGIEIDTISFKNLPEPGRGLQVANSQIFWYNITSVNNFTIFSRGFRFSIGYSKPFKIMSGYKGLDQSPKLVGSKMNITVAMLNVYRSYHLELNFFKSDIEATGDRIITFDTQGVGFNAFYNF